MNRLYYAAPKMGSDLKNYKEVSILEDWSVDRRWNEVDMLIFKSSARLEEGGHVRLRCDELPDFGGMITKVGVPHSDFIEYECLDYKRYLLTEVTYKASGQTASQILESIKGHVSVLKFKISKTTSVYPELEWEGVTVLDIIGNLMNLEFKSGNLIYFTVDTEAILRFESYPARMRGYSLSSAFNYKYSSDYSDIVTTMRIYKDGVHIPQDSLQDPALMEVWGDIAIEGHGTSGEETDMGDVVELSQMGLYNIVRPPQTDEFVEREVDHVNQMLQDIPHTITEPDAYDSLDNWGMSELIYNYIKKGECSVRIISYYSSTDRDNTRYTVQVKYPSRGWQDFDYKGFDSFHQPLLNRPAIHIIEDYVHELRSS